MTARATGNANNDWDPAAYDSAFGFVADYGSKLLDLLGDVAGRDVLDLGCGTGRLTAELADRGAAVVGLDLSPDMVEAARRAFPRIPVVQGDGQSMTLASLGRSEPFDDVFSNAALHWMPDGAAAARSVRGVMRRGGRFVAELGGEGNVAAIDAALRRALIECELAHISVPAQNYPSLATQSGWLESAGFAVQLARWYERPTPLGAGVAPADWTRHFRARVWAQVPGPLAEPLARRIDERAGEAGLHRADGWMIDYRRLQFVAIAA